TQSRGCCRTETNEANNMIQAADPLVHLGIIPDGNRRHAREAGMSTSDAHIRAADKGAELVGWCLAAGIAHVSAFGVSQENIALRPRDEIYSLHIALLHFCNAIPQLSGAALDLFGDATSLPTYVPGRACFIDMSARSVDENAKLVVHVGINYSAQAEMRSLLRAVAEHGLDAVSRAPNE